MDRVTNFMSQLTGPSCTVDGAAVTVSNPLNDFINHILVALKKLNEMSESMSLTPEELTMKKELQRSKDKMDRIWDQCQKHAKAKRELDTMEKAWQESQTKPKLGKKKIKEKWQDQSLEKIVDYYRNHENFWRLPLYAQEHFRTPKLYPKRTIIAEIKWFLNKKEIYGIRPFSMTSNI